MKETISTVLTYLGKAATIAVVVAEAGKKIMSLWEE